MKALRDHARSLGAEFLDRIGLSAAEVLAINPTYRETQIRKKTGGFRSISIPSTELLAIQRRLYRNLLRLLPKSKCAMGFVPGRSIASHAAIHASRQCVIRLDIKDFFPTTSNERIADAFRGFGWTEESISAVVRICCHPAKGGLPQGAATSPALSNIVNAHLDNKLAKVARAFETRYSRYADDLTFSTSRRFHRRSAQVAKLIAIVKDILQAHGYRLNERKTKVMGAGRRQIVTGLVVNDKAQLPRTVRRRLRAADHRRRKQEALENIAGPRPGSVMSLDQFQGWQALQGMTDAVSRNVLKPWLDLFEGDLEHRLKHAGSVSAALLRLSGENSDTRKVLSALQELGPLGLFNGEAEVAALSGLLLNRDVVKSYFTGYVNSLDSDLRAWRSRPLSHIRGIVIKVVNKRHVFAFGWSDSETCCLIADSLNENPSGIHNSEHALEPVGDEQGPDLPLLERLWNALYDRGLAGDVLVSSESCPAIAACLRTWMSRADQRSVIGFIKPGEMGNYVNIPSDLAAIEKEVRLLGKAGNAHLQRIVLARLMLRDLLHQRSRPGHEKEAVKQLEE